MLVFHDLLGIREGLGARFVKRYGNLLEEMVDGVRAFADDVRSGRYPRARARLHDRRDELDRPPQGVATQLSEVT